MNKKSAHNIAILRRFPEFMSGSGGKYLGSIVSVLVAVLTSFLTPLLIAGGVDAVTDTVAGRLDAPVNLPGFMASWFDARGGAEFLARNIWIVAILLVAVNLIGGLFHYLRGKWSAEASDSIAERMRNRLYTPGEVCHLWFTLFLYQPPTKNSCSHS